MKLLDCIGIDGRANEGCNMFWLLSIVNNQRPLCSFPGYYIWVFGDFIDVNFYNTRGGENHEVRVDDAGARELASRKPAHRHVVQ